jgi:hypothetical protein
VSARLGHRSFELVGPPGALDSKPGVDAIGYAANRSGWRTNRSWQLSEQK